MFKLFGKVRAHFHDDLTTDILKLTIIGWAIFIIILAIMVENKWLLATILAYEVLP
jgi:hypothetical protein